MKYIYIYLIIILSSCQERNNSECDYIKNYYPNIYKADYEYNTGNYEKAFDYYDSAFSNCNALNTPLYYEIRKFARVSAMLNKNDLALEFIKKDIESGYTITSILNDSVFYDLFKTNNGKEFLRSYDSLRSRYISKVDLNFRKEMLEIWRLDQEFRQDPIKLDSIDSIHEPKLIDIFEKRGYPNRNLIGHPSIDGKFIDVSTILRHTDDSIRKNYFIPKLKEFVEDGSCPPNDLAVVVDWYYLRRGEKQIYGMYPITKENTISNLNLIDENRISIGLPTLEQIRKKDSLFSLNQ
ncbi:hypothetical protein ACFQ1Q_00060 [Winogradskyella litorisediminis]|uniref:Tetratricopeptide repeat protein n=1 Tax=Winogradskyella litorisediminis TaxID=1156618 RepID=A0ABW3N4T1_9FLAO